MRFIASLPPPRPQPVFLPKYPPHRLFRNSAKPVFGQNAPSPQRLLVKIALNIFWLKNDFLIGKNDFLIGKNYFWLRNSVFAYRYNPKNFRSNRLSAYLAATPCPGTWCCSENNGCRWIPPVSSTTNPTAGFFERQFHVCSSYLFYISGDSLFPISLDIKR